MENINLNTGMKATVRGNNNGETGIEKMLYRLRVSREAITMEWREARHFTEKIEERLSRAVFSNAKQDNCRRNGAYLWNDWTSFHDKSDSCGVNETLILRDATTILSSSAKYGKNIVH